MLAFSEAEFFSSGPVFAYQAQKQHALVPIDLIVSAFTLTGIAMLVSEYCAVPMVGFILQPTCIPSADPNWKCVADIDAGNMLSVTDSLEEAFTSHKMLARLKAVAEENPFAEFSLPSLRKEFGLEPAETWDTIHRLNIPMIIPMAPGTFERPSDWSSRVELTDFIFLRIGKAEGGSLNPELVEFITNACAVGRKLVIMTFSSMPVARQKYLKCIVKMLSESQHQLALIFVGKKLEVEDSDDLEQQAEALKAEGRFYETARADFGLLFRELDGFIVHGGLGTTVEALRMHKPVAVSGLLLMDQRFWGSVCAAQGVGPEPTHIDEFPETCVDFIDRALADDSELLAKAESLTWGNETEDGVAINIQAFVRLLDEGVDPVRA